MKQFLKFFFAAFLALIIGGGLLLVIFFSIFGAMTNSLTSGLGIEASESNVATKSSNEILVVDLTRPINELSHSDVKSIFLGGQGNAEGLYDIVSAIKTASADDKIKGIYIKSGANYSGFATLQQIREAIKDFKKSGKFVVAYAESYSQMDYFTASIADSIYTNPMGSVEIKGLASTITFYKGTLDKLEIQPEIFYCGQFKSATEPFRLAKMSDQNRAQLAAMQKDLWSDLSVAFSERTKLSTEEIFQLANNYSIQTATDAIKYNFINGVKYKDEVESILRKLTSKTDTDAMPYISTADYLMAHKPAENKDQIAILVAEGAIVDGSSSSSTPEIASEDFIKEIRRVRDNDNIKAVVLRINSPGGSALASENIYRELLLLKAKKPYVVSMGDYAASGGYYIAADADSIYAMPSTITGSIGVFGMMFSTRELMTNKLGITFDTEKNAQYADFPNMTRPFTDFEKQIIQNSVDSTYKTFKTRVADGRKMTMALVDSVGQGRIWTGTEAVKLGLVDAIGDINRAINGAATIKGLNNYQVVVYPKQENGFAKFLKMLSGAQVQEMVAAEMGMQEEYGDALSFYRMMTNMKHGKSKLFMMLPYNIQNN